MIIKEVKEKLETSDRPVTMSLHQGAGFNVIIMGFKKGMKLKEHKTQIRSKLTVLEGVVIYKEENRILELKQYDEVEIAIEIIHSVESLEDSLCLLTKGE